MAAAQTVLSFPPPEEPAESSTRLRAKTLKELIAEKPKPQRRKGIPKTREATIEKSRIRMREMAESGDWSEAVSAHLVALYEFLHTCVYQVAPLELDTKSWALASLAAGRLVDKFFANDYGDAAAFLRWTWHRESEREQYRRQHHRDGARISWRLQFCAALVTDYRTHDNRTR